MTYLVFHVIFTLPALVLAWYFARKRLSGDHVKVILGVVLISVVAAAPWDAWAVRVGIWGFDWERATPVSFIALNKEWKLPAEEYAFFALMAIVVCLVSTACLPGAAHAEAQERKKARKEERYHY